MEAGMLRCLEAKTWLKNLFNQQNYFDQEYF